MEFKNSYIFSYPWEKITSAYLKKYPNNYSSHIKEVEYLDIRLDKDILNITRLLKFQIDFPIWANFFIKKDKNAFEPYSYIIENITIDRYNKTMKTKSKNLVQSSLLNIFEKGFYYGSSNNNTKYFQSINIFSNYNIISNFALKFISNRSSIGIKVLEEKSI